MSENPAKAKGEIVIDIDVLGHSYQVACKPKEREALQETIKTLEQHAHALKERYQLSSMESVLAMMCLNMARELESVKDLESTVATYEHGANAICEKIEHMLKNAPEQLKIL